MKLFKIKLNFLIIYLFTSIGVGATSDTIKLFRNNQLVSEIDTIENNTFFSINDFLSSTDSKPYISEKTEKIVFYIDNKKIKLTNGIAFLLIDENIYQLSSKVVRQNNEYFVPTDSFLNIINSSVKSLSIVSDESKILISIKLGYRMKMLLLNILFRVFQKHKLPTLNQLSVFFATLENHQCLPVCFES